MENETSSPVVSIGDWVLTCLITAIPVVGFVMLFVWAFSGSTNPSKANWAKATLIWFAVVIVLYIFIFAIFGASFLALMNR